MNASSMLSNKLATCAQQAHCQRFAITVTDNSKFPGMTHLAAFLQREGPAYFAEQAEREKMQKMVGIILHHQHMPRQSRNSG
ncbi:hypothetical protein [Pantoea stewartii]|nr:hypothetical protein [Pantoea stewartii]